MTQEVQAILNSKDKHLSVVARAGCMKSSTMLKYIEKNPTERIIFLVYNKEMQREFSERLKNSGVKANCIISTIHSLAYRWFISKYGKRSFKNITIIDIKNILGGKLEYPQLSRVKLYFEMFLCSDKENPRDLEPIIPEDKIYFSLVDRLWNHYKNSNDITHNVYLKLFQLSKPKLDCQTLIFDEYNDVSEVMLDIVANNLDKKVMCVGDDLQNLNSFAFSVDGLSIMEKKYGFKRYPLTISYRVSNEVASLSSRYLSYMYDEKISFTGVKTTKIDKLSLSKATKENQIVLLCRTRLGGLTEIMDLLDKHEDKKIYFVGGLDGFGINEIERLISYKGSVYIGGERFHINDLRKMLKEGVEDVEISRVVNIYNFYQKNNDCVEILKGCEVSKREQADIIVQTAHSSKGLTMENVIIGRDFPKIEDTKRLLKKADGGSTYIKRMIKSECNLLYVALTRATGVLDLNNCLNRNDKLSEKDKLSGLNENEVLYN